MGRKKERPDSLSSAVEVRLRVLLFVVGLLWTIEFIDKLAFNQSLDQYGIRPREGGLYWRIIAAPFLHGSFSHLSTNTIPFLVLGWLSISRRVWEFFFVSLLAAASAGALVWVLGTSGSVHVGASGIIFGYLGFLLARAVFEQSLVAILLALLAAALYGGMLYGIVPQETGVSCVSWEGHLGGFAGGVLSGWLLARPKSKAPAGK